MTLAFQLKLCGNWSCGSGFRGSQFQVSIEIVVRCPFLGTVYKRLKYLIEVR